MNNKPLHLILIAFLVKTTLTAEPLLLSEAYTLALQNNHAHKAKRFESDSASYAQEQREGKLYPQIQLSLNGGLHDYVQNYDLHTNVSEIYKSYTLSLTQPLYRPEVFISIDQGELKVQGAQTETFKSTQELGSTVAKAYFELIVAQRSLELAQANHRFYALKHTLISEMLTQGLSNKMDLLETQLYRDRAMMEINTAHTKAYLAQRKLEDLIRTPIQTLPSLSEHFLDNPEIFKNQSTNVEENNPDLRIANLSRRIAEQEIDLRASEHYPKIDLSLSRSENDTNDRAMYKTDNRAYVQISIPLYQGGQTNARINEAKRIYASSLEKEWQTRQEITYHIDELTQQLDLNLQNLNVLQTARTSAQLNLSAVEMAQKAGLKSQIDLLEARTKLYRIEQDSLEQFRDLVITHITLLELNARVSVEAFQLLENQLF
ncbi:TolC family protein [Sulfuricurvum sp.]|uniref:TolC family protein n=1 Tax=Sulfuricurvum sp. TaxID=2025608 RepID=UPI002E2EE233|nr:TolC family protein [Sulfuricurvum sp.]HEX5330358.1 TolC family protein [Sulfuricurvum sp.]